VRKKIRIDSNFHDPASLEAQPLGGDKESDGYSVIPLTNQAQPAQESLEENWILQSGVEEINTKNKESRTTARVRSEFHQQSGQLSPASPKKHPSTPNPSSPFKKKSIAKEGLRRQPATEAVSPVDWSIS